MPSVCFECQGPCDGTLGTNKGMICRKCAYKLFPKNMQMFDEMCGNVTKGGGS